MRLLIDWSVNVTEIVVCLRHWALAKLYKNVSNYRALSRGTRQLVQKRDIVQANVVRSNFGSVVRLFVWVSASELGGGKRHS